MKTIIDYLFRRNTDHIVSSLAKMQARLDKHTQRQVNRATKRDVKAAALMDRAHSLRNDAMRASHVANKLGNLLG